MHPNYVSILCHVCLRRLLIKEGSRLISIDPLEIKLIEASANYVNIITTKGKHLERSTMDNIEKKLTHTFFCRVHRSYIVNINFVKEVNEDVISLGDTAIPLNNKYAAAFIQRFLLFS